ncbi:MULTISPECIES: AzlD domain-containing protein [unclassified Ruminococcus]|uniref:AzlD domain-containing protein n=1 Tax=unclassified Ruminococcus TaxID=2608920 RepID=UPI00210CD25E|nr:MULTISPECIES: AzlD domain-containing protein [unclassified Ruminococcus]MCQ4022053.1 AzlD domain-containing protein [Ruminococcus sp. zg-924]MCQ4114373.1 AzlD domain-containing protein [Ruminococcus sp. zg-921]
MLVKDFFIYLFIMAGVTYLIRVIPFVIFRGKITNTFIKSFLYYVPYAVLGAMTFPAILFSTGNYVASAAGFAVACILAFKEKSLLTVAVFACAAALCINLICMAV